MSNCVRPPRSTFGGVALRPSMARWQPPASCATALRSLSPSVPLLLMLADRLPSSLSILISTVTPLFVLTVRSISPSGSCGDDGAMPPVVLTDCEKSLPVVLKRSSSALPTPENWLVIVCAVL